MVFSNVLTRALSLDSLLCLSSACCSSSLLSSLQVSACSAVHCSAATEAVLRLSNAVNACVRACVLRLLLLLRLQLLLSTTANSFRTETLAVLLSNALAPPAPRQALLLLLLLIVVNCCYIANTASARPQLPFGGEWLCKQAA